MAFKHVILTTLADAGVLRARVAARLGYPKPGLDIGGGLHVSAAESRTDFYTNFRKHPTLNKWALLVDGPTKPQLRGGDIEEDLTSDWDEQRPT